MPKNEPALAVTDLAKSYGGGVAVAGVSFSLPAGSITGLLGGNGAGKTTTIAMILGLVTPSAGSVRVLGADMPRQRYRVLHRMNFESPYIEMPMRLTVRQNLTVFGRLYGVPDLAERTSKSRASSTSSTCSTARPASSRPGRRPAPRSPRRCSTAPRCSSSTSRPRPWTPTPPTGCAAP
jgi:ABC-type multidrug transport system ATPase subunit